VRRLTKVLTAVAALCAFLAFGVASAFAAATVTIDPVTTFSYTSATVTGEIDGENEDSYDFEYSTDGSNWTEWQGGAKDPIPPGPQKVSKELTGLKPGTQYFVRLTTYDNGFYSSPQPDPTFTTLSVAPPTVSIAAPTGLTGEGAHFSGEINPEGLDPAFDVNWHFECTPQCPGLNGTLPADAPPQVLVPHEVTADPTNLQPGVNYEVSLVASNSGGQASAGPEVFSTPTIAPVIEAESAAALSGEATLKASLNPGGLATTYYFEYGTDNGYGRSTPAQTVAAGGKTVAVEASPVGLAPSTDYHYRLVASNAKGSSEGADQTFRTVAISDPALPDGRGYEMVSPVAKNGYPAGAFKAGPAFALASDDGNSVIFWSGMGPIGPSDTGYPAFTVGKRDAAGWGMHSALPRAQLINTIDSQPTALQISTDFSRVMFQSSVAYSAADAGPGGYRVGIYAATLGQPAEWLSRPEAPLTPAPGLQRSDIVPLGGSPDFSTVYFTYHGILLDEDAARLPAFEAGLSPGGLYRYTGGHLSAVGRLPDGTLDPDGAVAIGRPGPGIRPTPDVPAGQVSADGSRLFFVSPDPGTNSGRPSQLYVQTGDSSVLVSRDSSGQPSATGVIPMDTGSSTYKVQGRASENGRYVVFESTDALTADAPADASVKAYRFDVEAGALSYLAGVEGPVGLVTNDGTGVAFTENNRNTVKLWDHGTVRTMLEGTDAFYTGGFRVNDDGTVYAFFTTARVSGLNTGVDQNIFRYSTNSGVATCLSCPTDGSTPSGGAHFSVLDTEAFVATSLEGEVQGAHGMSSDGSRFFFDAQSALVAQDSNGVRDVYEWVDGAAHLISSGRDKSPSFVLDSSASGDDVFFATAEGINPADTDQGYDVYDARVGGPPRDFSKPAPCTTSCQLAAANPEPAPAIGTNRLSVPGAGRRGVARKAGKVRLSGAQVRSGKLKLEVTVPGRGTIELAGDALVTARRKVAHAGSFQIEAKLSAAARRSLSSDGKVAIELRLRFAPPDGRAVTKTLSVVAKDRG
jgi:hypothetical protein